jgi:hypothetical protein
MLADALGPPERLRRQKTDALAPDRWAHAGAWLLVEPDLALMRIKVCDRAQEEALSGTGFA